MAIAVPVLALLALAFILPNYLAIRYALLGDGTAAAGGFSLRRKSRAAQTAQTAQIAQAAPAPPRPRGVLHLWKALSPLLFAIAVIIAIAVGEMPGMVIAGAGLLNLLFGLTGWRGIY